MEAFCGVQLLREQLTKDEQEERIKSILKFLAYFRGFLNRCVEYKEQINKFDLTESTELKITPKMKKTLGEKNSILVMTLRNPETT